MCDMASASTANRRSMEGPLAQLRFDGVPSGQKIASLLARCWFPAPTGSADSRMGQGQARALLTEAIHYRMVQGDPADRTMAQVRDDIAIDAAMRERPGYDMLTINLTDGRCPIVAAAWARAIAQAQQMKLAFSGPHVFAPDIERDLTPLRTVSTKRGVLAWLKGWAVIGGTIATCVAAIQWTPAPIAMVTTIACVLLIGANMRGLATLVHESAHKTLASPRWLNVALGSLGSGWWVLQSRSRYHRSHVSEHHPHLGDEQRDPDTRQYLKLGLLQQDPKAFFRRNLLEGLGGAMTLVNLPYLLRDRLLPERGRALSREETLEGVGLVLSWAVLLGGLAYLGWLPWFLLLWALPYLTTFQCLNWLIEVSEHFPLIWKHKDPFLHTRNRKGPPAEQILTGIHGERWHRVHHIRPDLPFYHLEQAHRVMMRDRAYAVTEAQSGGLFCKGPHGEPAIIANIQADLAALHSNPAR